MKSHRAHKPESVDLKPEAPNAYPFSTFAANPGRYVANAKLLWVGAGDFFRRVAIAGTFNDFIDKCGGSMSLVDVLEESEIRARLDYFDLDLLKVDYFNVADDTRRRDLIYNRHADPERLFTHCYISNWPQAHLLSAVKYSGLCAGGDIIITKPLDLNIPMVTDIAHGLFPDIVNKLRMDDHYRNKGCIRALHRIFPTLQQKAPVSSDAAITKDKHDNGKSNGKLIAFRMWLVEPKTIEEEGRLRALECGVIWDLATHLVSLIQLFFLERPYQALVAYSKNDPDRISDIRIEIRKVLRMKYTGCDLMSDDAETLAVIELELKFRSLQWDNKTVKDESIKGLLVVGKGATAADGVYVRGVKQLDFRFEKGHVNLNLSENRLLPDLDDFRPSTETGFGRAVLELLTHSQRDLTLDDRNTPPGQFHCGMTFKQALDNIDIISNIKQHETGRYLLDSYDQKSTVKSVLSHLVGGGHLSRHWLNSANYGDFV